MTHYSPLLLTVVLIALPQTLPLSAEGLQKAGRAPVGCGAFFTGDWAGAGTVTEFGAPTQVTNTARYRADGSFASTTRYRGTEIKWTERKIAGKWKAAHGKAKDTCTLSLTSVTAAGESSSTTDVTIVDADTYRSFGVEIRRVR